MKAILALLVLLALPAFASDLTLAWDPSPGALKHNIYRIGSDASGKLFTNKVASVDMPQATITFTNVAPGAYTFYATAANTWGESLPSNTVTTPAGLPPAPGNLKLSITLTVP